MNTSFGDVIPAGQLREERFGRREFAKFEDPDVVGRLGHAYRHPVVLLAATRGGPVVPREAGGVEPLDFRFAPPRGPRETALGLVFLPRTIDKMRAALPGGNLNGYLVDYPRGLSAFLLKRVGVDLAAMQAEVAAEPDEAAVLAWFEQHADLSKADEVNAKLASLSIAHLSPDDLEMVHRIHPGIDGKPEIETFFDVFEFDDARIAAQRA